MNFKELTKTRYSLRKFSDKPVEEEKLKQILETARLAPTAYNYQPQRILVLKSNEAIEKFRSCTPYHFKAPLALLVCYDKTVSYKRDADGHDSGWMDASIVITHMMLAAAELGLGTTCVMGFNPADMVKAFAIPENLVPVAALPLGYPAETAKPSHLHEKRQPLEDTVFYNDFSAFKAE